MDSEVVNRIWTKCSGANIECAHYSYTTEVCKQKSGGMHILLMRTYLICGWLLWNGTHSIHLWWREKYCKKVLVSPVRGPGNRESLSTAPTCADHQNKFSEVSSEAWRELSFQFDLQMYVRVCMYMFMHVKVCVGIMGRLMLLWAWSRQRTGFLPSTFMWIPETELWLWDFCSKLWAILQPQPCFVRQGSLIHLELAS